MNFKKESAYADSILSGGEPLESVQLIAAPGKNFELIMTDAKVQQEHVVTIARDTFLLFHLLSH